MSKKALGGEILIGDELRVQRLGYGALRLLDVKLDAFGPPAPNVDCAAVLGRVVEAGINLIDTADIYGPCTNEEQISQALHPYPSSLVISTKGGLTRPEPNVLLPRYDAAHLRAAVEGSLRRLRLEAVDIWTLHHTEAATPIEEVAVTLANLRAEGKIRHVGLSKASVDILERARTILPIATVQNRYNVADRRDEAVLRYCEKHGIGFMAFAPLGSGSFDRLRQCVGEIAERRCVSMQQIALAWLLDRSPALIPIPGTALVSELADNIAACELILDRQELAEIDQRQAALPDIVAGPNLIRTASA